MEIFRKHVVVPRLAIVAIFILSQCREVRGQSHDHGVCGVHLLPALTETGIETRRISSEERANLRSELPSEIVIPVVFHIAYHGENQNLSDEEIRRVLYELNYYTVYFWFL